MMTLHVRVLALGLFVLTAPGFAQPLAPDKAPPAPSPAEDAEKPAVRMDLRDDAGTTVVGERESPIGLYITPWRNARAEQDIDRPARLLQVDMSPVDRDVFARQVEYHRALTEASRAKQAPTPAAPPAP